MGKCCNEMTHRLTVASSQTTHLITKTTEMKAGSEQIQLRSEVLTLFLERFVHTHTHTRARALDRAYECTHARTSARAPRRRARGRGRAWYPRPAI